MQWEVGWNGVWFGSFNGLYVNEIQSQSPMYLQCISPTYLDQNRSVARSREKEGGGREGFGRIRGGDWGLMEAENGFQEVRGLWKIRADFR